MRLKQINLFNFKSFGNSRKPVNGKLDDLRLMNLIFGHNNSGKSNLLKFLDLLFSRKTIRESLMVEGETEKTVREELGSFWKGTITDEPYIFHKNKRDQPIDFNVSIELSKEEIQNSKLSFNEILLQNFLAKNETLIVRIEGSITSSGDISTSTIRLHEVLLNEQTVYKDDGTTKEYFKGIKELKDDSQSFENLMAQFNESVLFLDKDRYLVSEREDSTVTSLKPHSFKNWLHNLSLDPFNYERYEQFVEFVKKYSDNIKVLKKFHPTFSKNSNGQIDVLISNGSERLPIGSFGTGIQQMLLLLAMIYETNARIILVEELELNLSPISQQSLLQIFSSLIKDKKIDQVIFTSHSKTLASTPNISVYEVEISEDGVSSIKDMQGQKSTFFKRDANIDTEIDKQMRSALREYSKPGPEWIMSDKDE